LLVPAALHADAPPKPLPGREVFFGLLWTRLANSCGT